MRAFEILNETKGEKLPLVRILAVDQEGIGVQRLDEGKWIDGRFEGNIRIDRDSHFASVDEKGVHAHVYGRTDRDNALIAVRLDGSASHGLKGKLHKDDAGALRQRGFKIPRDRIVEYELLGTDDQRLPLLEAL